MAGSTKLHVIDSHTAGEPTRVVVSGGPDLGGGSVADQRIRLGKEHDWLIVVAGGVAVAMTEGWAEQWRKGGMKIHKGKK